MLSLSLHLRLLAIDLCLLQSVALLLVLDLEADLVVQVVGHEVRGDVELVLAWFARPPVQEVV